MDLTELNSYGPVAQPIRVATKIPQNLGFANIPADGDESEALVADPLDCYSNALIIYSPRELIWLFDRFCLTRISVIEALLRETTMSDGYDPDHYETKKNRAHIERVMLMRECGVGLMPYCPCGDALKEQFYEGEKYWMCDKYKIDSFLHYRVRWDSAVTEDIQRLKEMNEEQEKALRELRFELEQTKREMRADKEAKNKEVEEVYDLVTQMACGCEGCKHNVENASHKNM